MTRNGYGGETRAIAVKVAVGHRPMVFPRGRSPLVFLCKAISASVPPWRASSIMRFARISFASSGAVPPVWSRRLLVRFWHCLEHFRIEIPEGLGITHCLLNAGRRVSLLNHSCT
jgi:hypothetical protein